MNTTGILTAAYIPAASVLEAREIERGIIDVNRDMDFMDFSKLIGAYKESDATSYTQFVNNPLIQQGDTTGQTILTSGTPVITVPLTAATSGFFRIGDVIKTRANQNGRIMGVSSTAGADTLTIQSVSGGNLTFLTGEPVVFSNNAIGEKGGRRLSLKYPVTPYYNLIQTFGESHDQSDIAALQKVTFTASNGQSYYTYYEYEQKIKALKKAVCGAMLGGQISTTQFHDGANATFQDANGNPIQTTMGLDQYATTYGILSPVATAGVYVKSDLDAQIAALLAKKSPKDMMVIGGSVPQSCIDTYLNNLNSSGVSSVKMDVNGEVRNLETTQYKYGGFTFEYKAIETFNDPDMYPSTGANIGRSMYYIPKGMTDTTTGPVAHMRVRYFDPTKVNPVSSEVHYADYIMEVGIPTISGRQRSVEWTTYQGLEFAGSKWLMKQTF